MKTTHSERALARRHVQHFMVGDIQGLFGRILDDLPTAEGPMEPSGPQADDEWRTFGQAHQACRLDHSLAGATVKVEALVTVPTWDGWWGDKIGVRYCKRCKVWTLRIVEAPL